ncbi:hypothetical protein GPJ56_005838 [Histomonas meleagridis]|uniref:uncharacterized protein n=1 Tax=Histomonas meleagridis TaxID=135588 RepID=UPI003559FAFB|nr:hypothetical protein GPJ56_005838 [Histomonas meleagridis]KAH0798626.1 hypothetical protein GO595_008491 [Histomonas meleagridis]
MEKEQLFEQLTTLSRGFLTNSKDPLHDYYTHEYEKLRTHINLIVALKIKFKDAFSFNYTEINVTIKRSCQHPANKISTQFLSTRIAIPILSAIPPTAEEMEDILTFAGAVIYFSELREIAAQLFNILLKAQPAKTTEHLCKNITQTLNVQQQSTKLSNYISLLSLLDFGDNSEAIVKIISLLLPRASSYLSNKDCAALFTASIIQPLVYSEFEIDSSVCKEWYDEIKISRSKHVKDKDILKRLISLSIAVHSSSLLAKCGKHIPILSEGFKFPELTRPILHLVYRILSTKEEKIVKDHPIEAVINRLPVSTLAYPQLMCKVLEQFAAVKEINEQAHFEALSKSDFYECLIYHKNITDTMRKNLISRSIQTSRFDILAKVVNGKTIESVIPYFCELLQNGFSTHKLVKHITKDPKNIVTSIDVIFNKVHLFNDRFDLKKCFFTLNKIIHNISIPICIEQLESLFAIASKQQFVFVECINSIQLTTFENCYIVGYFAIKNYELIKTDSHLALSIALALVTDNCIFPNCTDLLTLLSQIQWTSSSKPSLSRRRSAARVRKIPTAQQRTPEPAANSNQIPKENASRFIAGTVLNLTDVFIKVVVSIICSPGITPELCEKFVQVLMPWIKNLKLTSSSKFRYLFDPFFSNNCTEHVHYYIMRTIFPIFVDSQEMILNEFFRHNCKSNDYLIFYQFTDSKDKLIQFLESKILRLQKVQFFMQVLRHLQYLGSEEITDSKLLALMYPFFDNEDESIMKCVTNILEKCGTDKPSLKEIFEKKGEEFENEFLLNVISFLGYKMDTNVSNILFNYAKERAKQFTIEHMNQYINTMKRKKCHLQLLTQHFLSLYTLINEDIKPIIYEFAKFLIQTDHNEISKLAFDILKEKDGNDNLILQCIIRGTLTFDEIEPYVKLENLKKNYVFWYKMYKDMEINEEEFPEVDDLYCAVKYGSEELLQKIGNIIPDLINKGFRIQYLLNYLFDIDNLNISKIAPIFIAIPPQIYSFPKTGLEKPDLTIKLNIVLIKSREYRDFIHKFQIN